MYRYTRDEELYDILTATVEDLLPRQDEYGRFSTYTVEKEFCGWDIWQESMSLRSSYIIVQFAVMRFLRKKYLQLLKNNWII